MGPWGGAARKCTHLTFKLRKTLPWSIRWKRVAVCAAIEVAPCDGPNGYRSYAAELASKTSFVLATRDLWEAPKGARGSVVVKSLCYKPEGRGFDT
jgi:hypothetical protein